MPYNSDMFGFLFLFKIIRKEKQILNITKNKKKNYLLQTLLSLEYKHYLFDINEKSILLTNNL